MSIKQLLLFTFLSFQLLNPALAGKIKAGPEWEVTNGNVHRGDQDMAPGESLVAVASNLNIKAQARMGRILKNRCRTCIFEAVPSKLGLTALKVTFPELNNYWVVLNVDPGTVEIQGKPLTIDEYKSFKDSIQYYVFDTAKSAKLTPRWDLASAGHIHLDIASTFNKDRILFRNFIVDYFNNPQLASGILENDHGNAPPLRALTGKQIEAMQRILADFDNSQMTIQEFAQRIINEVQDYNPRGWTPTAKFQALNLLRIVDPNLPEHERTLEIRALRAQRNMEEYILTLELFQTRLDFLEKQKGPIPFNMPTMERMTPAQSEIRYRAYVETAGGSWDKFKALMPKYAENSVLSEADTYGENKRLKEIQRLHHIANTYQNWRDQDLAYDRMKQGLHTVRIHDSNSFYKYVSTFHPTVLPIIRHPQVFSLLQQHPQYGWMTAFSRMEIVRNQRNFLLSMQWETLQPSVLETAFINLSYPLKNLTQAELDREYQVFQELFERLQSKAKPDDLETLKQIQMGREEQFHEARNNFVPKTEVKIEQETRIEVPKQETAIEPKTHSSKVFPSMQTRSCQSIYSGTH
jgi:hypothetical protein